MPQPSSHYTPHPLAAAKPTGNLFDPWNSSSTGHQRAENVLSGSTSWRDSRTLKLGEQFKDGQRGGKRVSDTVGAGSEGFGKDGRLENGGWAKGASGLRKGGQKSLFECFGGGGVKVDKAGVNGLMVTGRKKGEQKDNGKKRGEVVLQREIDMDFGTEMNITPPSLQMPPKKSTLYNEQPPPVSTKPYTPTTSTSPVSSTVKSQSPQSKGPQIFRNLTIYINGSTFPVISDHKLKRLLASHGANLSISLGRRTVTHVILGTPNADGKGAGGALASSKIQKEIVNVRGKGVKFVSVEWVVESVRQGKRLSEAGFEVLRLASRGQGSVWGTLKRKECEKGEEIGMLQKSGKGAG